MYIYIYKHIHVGSSPQSICGGSEVAKSVFLGLSGWGLGLQFGGRVVEVFEMCLSTISYKEGVPHN